VSHNELAGNEPGELLAGSDEVDTAGGNRRPDPLCLVIFGASGDLTRRKILPALSRLATRGSLP
jgi:hypothetical protein